MRFMGIKVKALLKSLWAIHLSSGGCNNCHIALLDCLAPGFDIERFGIRFVSSIRHADILFLTGSCNRKSSERLTRLRAQVPEPCFVIGIGECAMSRGIFIQSYNCPVPLDAVLPVDIYIPGCPPDPEAVISGLLKLIQKIKTGLKKTKKR
jgi:Ni,Fe-hydrogenase III small subunit